MNPTDIFILYVADMGHYSRPVCWLSCLLFLGLLVTILVLAGYQRLSSRIISFMRLPFSFLKKSAALCSRLMCLLKASSVSSENSPRFISQHHWSRSGFGMCFAYLIVKINHLIGIMR